MSAVGWRWGRLAALLLLVLPAELPARADYRDRYAAAIRARDFKDWSTVVTALKAASSEKPQEGELVQIYGQRYERYLPYYNLGLAYFNMGNCAEALKAFDESDRQGAIRRLAEYKELQRISELCRSQLPRPTPVPPVVPTAMPELDRRTPEAVFGAPEQEAAKPGRAKRGETPEKRTREAGTPAETDRRKPEPPRKPTPANRPPEPLVQAVRAYLQGDYGRVTTLLASIDLPDRRAAAQAHMFRSAALYAAYVLGGEKDASLLNKGLEDARESRRLDPTIAPSSYVFSPRFTAFFAQSSRLEKSAS